MLSLLALLPGSAPDGAIAADKAPNVALVDVDGAAFNLTDYRGEVLLLDFMSLTCDPCKVVAQDLKRLHDDGIEDLNIISIDIQPKFDSVSGLRDYATSHGYVWRFAMDTNDGDALQSYGVIEIPVVVIIDRDGYVTYSEKGLQGYDQMKKAAEAALSGEAKAIDLLQIGLVGMAFLAGLASFFSPCSFPLLPGYITYYFKQRADARVEGDAGGGSAKPAGRSAATGLKLGSFAGGGIVLVYGILGVVIIGLVLVGVGISDKAISYMKPVVGIILLVMGAFTLLDVPINTGYITAPFSRLWERVRPPKGPRKPSTGPAGLFLYGVAYGSASASCSVPIFIALVGISVSTGNPMDALVTFLVFLFSMWLLMAVMTSVLSVGEERVKKGLMRHYIAIKKVTGVVFIVAGGYLMWLFLKAEGVI